MKRITFILCVCALMIQVASAQLKVAENGNAGIGTGNNTLLSSFVVGNNTGESNWKAVFYSDNMACGLKVIRGQITSGWSQAIMGVAPVTSSSKTMGVYGTSTAASPTGTGRAFGVLGYASNATAGYNYGAMGVLAGSVNGAAVIGTLGSDDVYVNGLYAGYFNGNVRVTGTINGITVGNSDIRYKQNIVELGNAVSTNKSSTSSSVLNTVLQMTPVQYNLKQVILEPESDTTTVRKGVFEETSQMFQKKHYGLIAQDLQKLYPDLVYEDDNGYLSINYTGIIPLLIQSIKELQAQITDLQTGTGIEIPLPTTKSVGIGDNTGENASLDNAQNAALYQNAPNPFSQSTQIKYYLPSTVSTAYLCIYDLQGKQLKQINLVERDEGSQIISASEFSAGIYLYALLADGREVDVKRMILTE